MIAAVGRRPRVRNSWSVIPRGARRCRAILIRSTGVAVRLRVRAAIPRRCVVRAVLLLRSRIARSGRRRDAGCHRARTIERRRRIGREPILRRLSNVNVMRYD